MNTEQIMVLADAYAAAEQHDYLTGEASADHARAALEAALTEKQGEQALQDVSDPAPSVNAQERPSLLPPDNDPMVLRMAERISELEAQNAQLLEALKDIAYGLEKARIWGGMDWKYNPLHPFIYLPLRDKARAAIAAVEGKV